MIGRTISHYRIEEKIGAGGMGEVYRATDTKLGRSVALKLLPRHFVSDPERLARFRREAQVLASLNHPHIGSIYGIEDFEGSQALVLELVEGPTLFDRLQQGRLPLEESLAIASQIAEAVELAHGQGVIHRDLKPANVKLTGDGQVKVLDFGLAKALEPAIVSGEDSPTMSPTLSPTITGAMTGANVILGTAAYMSPEQARGQEVDKRADVWSFGVVLYEMLTGRNIFKGDTVSDTLAGVLKSTPEWDSLPADTPPRIRRLLARCLEKDPKRRLRDIGDAHLAIDETIRGVPDGESMPGVAVAPARTPWLPIVGTAVVALVLGLAAGWFGRPQEQDHRVRRSLMTLGDLSTSLDSGTTMALSPDGRHLAFTSEGLLWVRELSQLGARSVPGTEGAKKPFWSPDGTWIGYGTANRLLKVPVAGGAPVPLCEIEDRFGASSGATWGEDGRIAYTTGGGAVFTVSDQGGDPHILVPMAEGEADFHNVTALPKGDTFAFVIHTATGFGTIGIQANGERRTILELPEGESVEAPVWSPTGHLVFGRFPTNAGVWALPFSPDRLEPTGEAFLVAADGTQPTISSDGTLAYLRDPAGERAQMMRVDLAGRAAEPIGPVLTLDPFPAVSPDGSRIALTVTESSNDDIWVQDLERGTLSRLTFHEGNERNPVWSADGARVFYSRREGADSGIYWCPADGTGEETRVADGYRPFVSADGRYVAYNRQVDNTGWDIFGVQLDEQGRPTGEEIPLVSGEASDWQPVISPNGKFLAYLSNESGGSEVYIRPFPEGRGKWQASLDGGHWPHWSADGRELWLRGPEGILRIDVEYEPGFRLGRPELLFEPTSSAISLPFSWPDGFGVLPGGEGFVIFRADPASREAAAPERGIVLVQNWFEEFRRD